MEWAQQETARPGQLPCSPGVTHRLSLTQTHIRGQTLSALLSRSCSLNSSSAGKAPFPENPLLMGPAQTPPGTPGRQAGCLKVGSVQVLFLCSSIPLANTNFSTSYILSRVSRSLTAMPMIHSTAEHMQEQRALFHPPQTLFFLIKHFTSLSTTFFSDSFLTFIILISFYIYVFFYL